MAVVNRTGIVLTLAQAQYKYTTLQSGNCLVIVNNGDMVGPVNFAWGTRYTCFFKAKMTSLANASSRLIVGDSGDTSIILTINGIQVNNAGTYVVSDAGVLKLNEWHDYAVVYDGQFMRCYRDGAPVDSKALTHDPLSTAQNYTLFNRSDGLRPCAFNVCEFQWYNRAFQPTDIAAHYRSDPNNTTNLVLRYKFQEGTGTTITDSTGNYNTTLTQGSWSTFTLNAGSYYNGLSSYGYVPTGFPGWSHSSGRPNSYTKPSTNPNSWTKPSGNGTSWSK